MSVVLMENFRRVTLRIFCPLFGELQEQKYSKYYFFQEQLLCIALLSF